MASRDLILRVQTLARKNGLDPDKYTVDKIIRRERDAIHEGKSHSQFANELLDEVSSKTQGYSKCPECGEMSLVHEGGCMSCRKCGYSKCG